MNDDQLQEYLDHQANGKPESGKEYQMLFDALNDTENDILPAGFAHRVTARLESKKSKDPIRKWTVVFAIFLALSALVAAIVIAQVSWYLPSAEGVNIYLMFLLGAILMGGYNFLERRRKRDLFHD